MKKQQQPTREEEYDELRKMGLPQHQIDFIAKFEEDFTYKRSRLVKFIVNNLMYDNDLLALYSALSYWTATHELIIQEDATKRLLYSKDQIDNLLQACVM
jgi:hypothetical protein